MNKQPQQPRDKFLEDITVRQNQLYLRARFVQGATQKERKQQSN